MKERPILFNSEMVRAILSGHKTQTRRVWKNFQPMANMDKSMFIRSCPFGQRGDRLWVKESHRLLNCQCRETCWVPGHVWYEADSSGYNGASLECLRPSIHMPRWASRITLEVTGVRVEQVQDISGFDAFNEGVWPARGTVTGPFCLSHIEGFKKMWDSIYSKRGLGWDVNPWVWVVDFRMVENS